MEFLSQFIDLFLHLDVHLREVVLQYGVWTYLILFLIVFCETGLVVTPVLPGDSLLFAAGTLAAQGTLDTALLFGLLCFAAVLGDAVNYSVGHYLGPKAMQMNNRILKREYLEKTQSFYNRYGGKTIVLARFVPIVRTFAPFLAGVGKMPYSRFATFNVIGALLWISVCLSAGIAFGGLEIVKKNFSLVLLAVVGISVLPAVVEILRARKIHDSSKG